jgi:small-conductance mechanosensitive channel
MAMHRRTGMAALLVGALLVLASAADAQKLPKSKPPKPEPKREEVVLPALPLAAEQADAFLASLTDAQARRALAQVLKHPPAPAAGAAAAPGGGAVLSGRGLDPVGALLTRFTEAVAALKRKLAALFSETEAEAERDGIGQVVDRVTGGRGAGQLLRSLLALAAILAGGVLLRWLVLRRAAGLDARMPEAVRRGRIGFFARVAANLLWQTAGAAIFAGATLLALALFYDANEPAYALLFPFLIAACYVVLLAAASEVMFAPRAPGRRLFPLPDGDAAFMHRGIVVLSLGGALFGGASGVIAQAEGGPALFLSVYSLGGAFITAALLVMIWKRRARVAAALAPPPEAASGLRAVLARRWHWFAALYVVVMGGLWIGGVLQGERVAIANLIVSLFVIPVFAGLDQWGQRLLKIAAGEGAEVVDLSGEAVREIPPPKGRGDIQLYAPLIRKVYRLLLAAFLFFAVLRLWGLDLEIGRIFTAHVLSIIVTLALGFVAWEFTKARIDAKLRLEMPAADDDHEEGGAGGSRTGTLLILLRKFIATVLFVIVSLIVLSSIGVNIGPLIAGAGVIGLAIGFGAQTLVRDIIAGIFFLIDDAFRVGDYVEAGTAKGSVEHLSLRSIRLRHPRGQVYTIPFGNLKSVTNFTRDYIIMKLDIRLRFDADLEKVRKIIKRINKRLRQDEELNRVMLDDLKSQGVREFDDSAMIVRVKFKTIPGEQFVLRRLIYKMIQEEFRAAGIEFAHRNVTVYLPPEAGAAAASPAAVAAAGAAAAALAQAKAEAAARAKAKPAEEG